MKPFIVLERILKTTVRPPAFVIGHVIPVDLARSEQ